MAVKHITYPFKILLGIYCVLIVCLLISVAGAQTEGQDPQQKAALAGGEIKAAEGAGESLDSIDDFENRPFERSQIKTGDSQISTQNNNQGLSPWRTFGSLLIVLSLIIAVTYIFRRLALGGRGGLAPSGVEVLARNSINPKQSLCLVKLGPRVLLLGLSPNQMTALHTIEDPDEVAEVVGDLERSRPQSISNTFGKLLHRESQVYNEDGGEQNESNLTDDQSQQWCQAKGELTSLLDKVKGLTRMRFRS
ncbi:MAG: hypothetical protein GY869_12295 [Planctomycetes bacterium]|nr:hypothetical protein [Planctomycetota bacterium]